MKPDRQTRVEDAPTDTHAWTQTAAGQHLPQRGEPHARTAATASSAQSGTPHRRWWHTGLRVARDATLGLLLIAAVPLGYVAAKGDRIWFNPAGARERIAQTDRLRPLMAPKDGQLSAAAAGYAYHALQPSQESVDFPLRTVDEPLGPRWNKLEATSLMFADYRAVRSGGLPSSAEIVSAAASGFSDDELAYLRSIAEDPIWNEIEEIAGAREVDIIGGRFVLPFRTKAPAFMMPIHKFAGTKELAYAGVSRAAYYLAIGEPARAEAALKTVVSFGFVLIDNGTSAIDGLIGTVVANIGRDGLYQLYSVTGDAAGKATAAEPSKVRAAKLDPNPMRRSLADIRARMSHEATDPRAPRTVRFEALHSLSLTTCGSVSSVLFGHSAETESSFRDARAALARFPSEHALLDLYYALPEHAASIDDRSLFGRIVLGAAAVTGTITQNPRVVTCTRILLAVE